MNPFIAGPITQTAKSYKANLPELQELAWDFNHDTFIHDNDGLSDLHQIPFTFARTRENKSSTDWAGFLQGLREIQYQGTLNFETAPVLTAFPSEMQVDVLSFLAQIGNYFADKLGRKGAYESDGPFERSM